MKKVMLILVAMAFVAFGYTAVLHADMDKSKGKDAKDLSAWIGKDVKNTQGEELGRISDFVKDEGGAISLVIVSREGFMGMGEKKVAAPFEALSFNESEDHAVLDATEEQFANAPAIGENENLNDPAFAEEVHRYFGERPSWTDEATEPRGYFGTDEGIDTNRGAVEDYQSQPLPYGDY